MRILHVAPYIDARFGGPPVAIEQIALASARTNIQCDLAAVVSANENSPARIEQAFASAQGRVYRFPVAAPRSWFFAPDLNIWLKHHVCHYDLVHLHVPFTYPMFAGARHSRAAGKPYAIMPHGSLDPWSLSHKRIKKKIYYSLVERTFLKFCSGINVTSVMEQDSLTKLGFGHKISITTLCVETPNLRESVVRPNGPLRLLYLSRIHLKKDLPTLLAALRSVNSAGVIAVLDIVGSGELSYVSQIEAQIDVMGLRSYVTMRGFLEGAEKAAAYQAADVFVLPSLHENFCVAVAESLSYGVPVVVSDQVGIAAEIAQANAGLVIPAGDPKQLAKAILQCTDARVRRNFAAAARRLAIERYSLPTLTRELQAFYSRNMAHA